jgi:hypothetical protein
MRPGVRSVDSPLLSTHEQEAKCSCAHHLNLIARNDVQVSCAEKSIARNNVEASCSE